MLEHNIFSDTFHCVQLACLLIFDQVHLSESTSANKLNDLEVLEKQDVLVGVLLEQTFSSVSALGLNEFVVFLYHSCEPTGNCVLSIVGIGDNVGAVIGLRFRGSWSHFFS